MGFFFSGGFPDLEMMDEYVNGDDDNSQFFSVYTGGTEEKDKIPVQFVSFDDYYVLWKGIATSIVDYKQSREHNCKYGTSHAKNYLTNKCIICSGTTVRERQAFYFCTHQE